MRFNHRDKEILHLAIPSIISNITVPLLGLVDLAIVGHISNETLIAAISVGSMIFNVIYWIFGFLRMGTSGLTSQALGRRDFREVMVLLRQSLTIGFLVSLVFIVFQVFVWWMIIGLMQPSTDIIPHVRAYYNICIWGAPAMLCLYGLSGWFIGMQNTRIPMMVSILQNIINIMASLFLVFVLKMKIEGVALGTLIAQWSGLLIAVLLWLKYYRRLGKYHDARSFSVFFNPRSYLRFFQVNRDIFFRTLFLVSVFLFFTSAGARQGDMILSVNTLLMTFFTLFSYIMDGFAFAGEALSGKYYGARNVDAFHEVYRCLFKWGLAMIILFTAAYAFGGTSFLHLLTDSQEVIMSTKPYFLWALLIPMAGMAAFVYDGIFIGVTATRGMLLSCACAAIMFFMVYLSLSSIIGNHALWLALIVFLAMRGILQWLYFGKKIHLRK